MAKKVPGEQGKIRDYAELRPTQFKPGQSGNPSGRPKGSVSLKEYARKMLLELDDDGKREFMAGLEKDIIWKMAEGNPKQDTQLKADLTISEYLDSLEHGQTTPGQDMATEQPIQDQG